MIPAASSAGTIGEKAGESIAIVGIGSIFPGASDPEQFWNIIADGRSMARQAPPGRWLLPADQVFDPAIGRIDRVYSRTGCFIDTPLDNLNQIGRASCRERV